MSQLSVTQLAAFLITVAAHAAMLGWVSQYSPRANPVRPAKPMTVSLFAPAPPASRDAPKAGNPLSAKADAELTPPPVRELPVKKPALAAPQERAMAPDDPSPNVAPTTVPATEAAPAALPLAEAPTPARGDAAYLRNPAPSYPLLSRRLGEQGRVLLRVLVHADGSAMSVEIETGSGHTRLDQAARATVRQWRFIPAMQGDQAVNSWAIIPVDFSLKG